MVTAVQQNKNLERLVEQKILEFLGDPDSGLVLKKSFVNMLARRMRKKKFVSHAAVLKKYGGS